MKVKEETANKKILKYFEKNKTLRTDQFKQFGIPSQRQLISVISQLRSKGLKLRSNTIIVENYNKFNPNKPKNVTEYTKL